MFLCRHKYYKAIIYYFKRIQGHLSQKHHHVDLSLLMARFFFFPPRHTSALRSTWQSYFLGWPQPSCAPAFHISASAHCPGRPSTSPTARPFLKQFLQPKCSLPASLLNQVLLMVQGPVATSPALWPEPYSPWPSSGP